MGYPCRTECHSCFDFRLPLLHSQIEKAYMDSNSASYRTLCRIENISALRLGTRTQWLPTLGAGIMQSRWAQRTAWTAWKKPLSNSSRSTRRFLTTRRLRSLPAICIEARGGGSWRHLLRGVHCSETGRSRPGEKNVRGPQRGFPSSFEFKPR